MEETLPASTGAAAWPGAENLESRRLWVAIHTWKAWGCRNLILRCRCVLITTGPLPRRFRVLKIESAAD